MFDDWISQGAPKVFWVSGFFFTHSFLAGVKQNFARAFRHPFDRVDFEFVILKQENEAQARIEGPKLGSFIDGLYLEGAGWDLLKDHLCESALKVIHIRMPVMHLVPVLNKVMSVD
jgi:dynein heavy chain, axonemal